MFSSASEVATQVDRAFWYITAICVALLIGVTAAMVYFAVRFRRSKTRKTSQIEGNMWVEVTWVVVPTLIVLWMFWIGYQGFGMIRGIPDPEEALDVEVTGRQWAWSFHYPEQKVDATEMVVPKGEVIRLSMSAPQDDVIHNFFLPEFRIKEDVLPGETTYMWFQPEREGKYNIFCAEYCGLDHARMIADLRVVSEEAFHDWARQQVTRKFQPLVFEAVADPQHPKFEELGIQRDDLYATFCVSCHGPEGAGTGIEEARNFQQLDENWKNGGKVTDIFRTLTEGIEGTRMAAYPQFSAWQKVALAHKVRSFMPEGERPETTREDYDELEAEYRLDQIQVPKEPISVDRAMDILVAESAKK